MLYRRVRFCACSGIVSFPRMARWNTDQERRTVENGELRFNGQIKWSKGENTIQWSAPQKTPRQEGPICPSKRRSLGVGTQLRIKYADNRYYRLHRGRRDWNNSK